MSAQTYYRDHWVRIEPERLDRYESQFAWGRRGNRLLEPAAIEPGQTVGDYGCGPGFLSLELAQRVGPAGHVHAFDINAEFVARTRRRVDEAGLGERATVALIEKDELPIADDTLDRLIAKNVMVYVDDPLASLREFRRVVRPGGRVHVVDSDFYMAAFEPISIDDWRAVLDAGIHAFRTPTIGRKLYGLARQAGFSRVEITVIAEPETTGRMLNFILNMAGYAREGGHHDEAAVQRVVDVATRAVEEGTFFALNPQFLMTAIV